MDSHSTALEPGEPRSDEASPMASLKPPALASLAAFVVFVTAALIALENMATSNRPHELTSAPLVAAMLAANLGICVWAFRRLVRYASHRPMRRPLAFYALGLGLAFITLLSTLVFLGAAGTVPDVLGD